MDPNANLAEQRKLAASIVAHRDAKCSCNGQQECLDRTSDDADRLAELVEALDGWLSIAGFLPATWARDRKGETGR